MTLLCDYLPGPMFDDEAGTCGPALRGLVALSHLQSLTVAALPSLSRVWLFVTPGPTAPQASRSITVSWSLLKPMSIESVMPSNRLILCHPLLLLPSICPSIRVFSNELALHIRWLTCCRWPQSLVSSILTW